MHSTTGPRHQPPSSPLRRLAVGAAVIGVVIVSSAAVGIAGDNGRDGGTVPGVPTDAPAPVVDERSGRDGLAPAPNVVTRSKTAPIVAGPLDNGRGGIDPAVGPNPIPVLRATAAPVAIPAHDTDSGLPSVNPATSAKVAADPIVDLDVPGAATASTLGADRPSRDADGDS